MASTWDEHLCVQALGEGKWLLGIFQYEILGSIYEAVDSEDDLYDDNGDLKVPTEYQGRRITGLADGEYLQTDELIHDSDHESVTFDKSTLDVAHDYAVSNGWNKRPGFKRAWGQLLKLVG